MKRARERHSDGLDFTTFALTGRLSWPFSNCDLRRVAVGGIQGAGDSHAPSLANANLKTNLSVIRYSPKSAIFLELLPFKTIAVPCFYFRTKLSCPYFSGTHLSMQWTVRMYQIAAPTFATYTGICSQGQAGNPTNQRPDIAVECTMQR